MNALEVIANLPEGKILYETALQKNLTAIQYENQLPQTSDLVVDEGMVLREAGNETWRYPSFTVEMETGTGKTYVYLRTIYELRHLYGFSKFVIVVPSVAIYQGVVKTFQITRSHFRALYENEIVHLIPYDGNKPAELKTFATSSFCEILLITLDSFNRISNTMYKSTDKLPGSPLLPYQYLQQTRPILVLDEPQNMDSETAKVALRTLHPLLALRYSATHLSLHNQVYRLTPVEALRQNLVKKIEVYGITEENGYQPPSIALVDVSARGPITAQVRTRVTQRGIDKEDFVTLRSGADLQKLTGRAEHAGYVVRNISAVPGDKFVEFANEITIRLQEVVNATSPAVFRQQIRETIQRHFAKQLALQSKNIKVLSLFFIDRVANYTDPEDGIIRKIFDEEYTRLAASHPYFSQYAAEEVRSAYFASYKKKARGQTEQTIPVEEENPVGKEEKEALREAFQLIMKGKETLLTLPTETSELGTRVAFIFAHSALKEGWDNPNVFQICTLNQAVSERRKRQEIGRGLRLSVDQSGNRVTEDGVNVLTVIANESYASYVASLQNEYKQNGLADSQLPPKPSDANRAPVTRNEAVFTHPDFTAFWEKLATRLDYTIKIDTEQIINHCRAKFSKEEFSPPTLLVQKGQLVHTEFTLSIAAIRPREVELSVEATTVPKSDDYTRIRACRIGDDLGAQFNEPKLRGYKIHSIEDTAFDPGVVFTKGEAVTRAYPKKIVIEGGQHVIDRQYALKSEDTYPVFDLMGRTAAQTGLTRQTIYAIFANLSQAQQLAVTKNPEGFATKFIATIKSVVAKSVSENVEFRINATQPHDLEALFPVNPTFIQEELIQAGASSIYEQVQIDSGVEKRFVENRLMEDEQVVFYFKFPAKFKIQLPSIIGNYIPDWGIVRKDEDGKLNLYLVRETKGSEHKEKLRFDSEGLKITCAEKYFDLLGIPYRHLTDKIHHWHHPRSKNEQITIEA